MRLPGGIHAQENAAGFFSGEGTGRHCQPGGPLGGVAQALSPGQVEALGREITELARTVNQHLWSWDDPKGELFGEPDCRELLYRIQRLEESPRLFPLKKL